VTRGGTFVGQTVDTARRVLAAQLRAEENEAAELDARLLIGAVLGLDLTGLIAAATRRLTDDEAARLLDFALRRRAGEPVARILGMKEFWGLPLSLGAATLVPRPDTETVVEAALEMFGASSDRPLRIADVGTGSGAILLALLSEWPQAWGIGTDVSEATLRVADGNAVQLGLKPRAAFVACDYLAALSGRFDLIVSNPPYIPTRDIDTLAIEVREHDPRRALDGGTDGLDAYRAIVPQATRLLAPGGALVFEVGQGQSTNAAALLTMAGLSLPETAPRRDLAGIPRAVMGRKPPE
jgi:release factor glutamine methyltransferase